ncbi:MAG TPA: citramalate synthase, partial [Desulfosalsimonadaceae bacterium]|nr:citramalate synthase [Desulfosalsimonadaceae bacterium]
MESVERSVMEQVFVYDTTLRDGTQGENINFSAGDKLKIARKLDEMGAHYIEGGWPGSNERDENFFAMARAETFHTARLTAFGSTHKFGVPPEEDRSLNAIIASGASVATIFGKSWDLHVNKILNIEPEDNLGLIRQSVAYLKQHQMETHYDAEHFFDGYKENPEYAVQTLKAAVSGGADALVLCDTNGGTLPHEIEQIMISVREALYADPDTAEPIRNVRFGIHAHNDSGLAVANTITAVRN